MFRRSPEFYKHIHALSQNQFCIYGMAKSNEVLDWYGNPIPGVYHRTNNDNRFKIYEDEHGKKYWLNEGERDYELPYLVVSKRNGNGASETVYDSRCNPPLLAKG
jgi:hypothetical protein